MGKIAIITFDDSEDITMERICSILVGEEQFEEVKLGQGFVLTFSELKKRNTIFFFHLKSEPKMHLVKRMKRHEVEF